MAATTDQVIIEFISDTSQLEPGLDQLEQFGAIDQNSAAIFTKTNKALQDRNLLLQQTIKSGQQLTVSTTGAQDSFNKLVTTAKNLSGESKKAVDSMLKLGTGDLARGFKAQKVSVDEYVTALQETDGATDNVTKKSTTLKGELRQLTAELANLGERTAENAAQFDAISNRAGEVQNALKDARQVVQGLGEDVPILKTFGAAAQGITAGFSAASGAIALFGDEDKDLQQVLVRVNALMAVQQGVSSLVALANDKATIATAKLAAANIINNAQTTISNGLESKSVVTRAAATVAQYALNLAMSLNPIGIVTLALAGFIAGLVIYTGKAKLAAEETARLNAAIASAGDNFDAEVEGLKRSNEEYVNELQARNAKESEIQRANATNLKSVIAARARTIQQAEADLQTAQLSRNKETLEKAQELRARIIDLYKQQADDQSKLRQENLNGQKQVDDEALAAAKANADARIALAVKNSDNLFAAQRVAANAQAAIDIKAAGDNEEKVNQIRAQLHRELLDINAAQDAVYEQRRQAAIAADLAQEQIIARRINSDATARETELQIKAIQDRANFEARQEGVSVEERVKIRKTAQLQIEQLQRDQAQREITIANENQNALIKVALDGVQIENDTRLALETETVRNETAIALAAQNLTEQKRLAIISASEAKIRELKNNAIQKAADDQIQLNNDINDAANSELERQLQAQNEIRNSNNPKKTAGLLEVPILNIDQQKAAIDELTSYQLQQNQILLTANAAKEQSQQDFEKTQSGLVAQGTKIFLDGEEKKRQAVKATAEFQTQMQKAIINTTIQGIADGLNLLGQLYQQQDAADQARLDARKKAVQDELEAGVITQKAADVRNKELEAQQKQLARDQAKRNKELAIFQAIVGTAQAVIAALNAPPPLSFISAAIAGALGAAQIAIIASQPLPQFNKGKKDAYEGFGEVAERGRPELLELDGKHYLAQQKSIVWLGARDKVYTPDETSKMLSMPSMNFAAPVLDMKTSPSVAFDYDKLGKAVADNVPATVFSIDGYKEFIQTKRSFETRLNARRKWLK